MNGITVRALRNRDTNTVDAVLRRLGPESLRLRFGISIRPRELDALARVDGRQHVLVAYDGGRPIALAHLSRDDDPRVAEIAVAVADDWQQAGVGTALLRELTALAAAVGITHVRAVVKLENRPSLSLVRRALRVVTRRIEGGELHVLALTN
jgi:N-acetylglutamate synthase-like GNAT family acetyltransferase